MLKFRADGSFRILQINDFQDNETADPRSVAFLDAILDKYRPDLAVLVGDQLSPDALMTEQQMKAALKNELQPLEERGIPFLYTFGNHDHDQDASLDRAGQAALYDAYAMSRATHNGRSRHLQCGHLRRRRQNAEAEHLYDGLQRMVR